MTTLFPAAELPRLPVRRGENQESVLFRGFRLGVGFMLAVVTILLVLVLLLLWLSTKPGWKRWLEQLGL